MQDTRHTFEMKRPSTSNNLVYIHIAISKPYGNHKLKNRYIYKRKSIQTQYSRYSSNRKREQKRKERKKTYKNKPKTFKKMQIGSYISILTLNENEWNAPIKRHRLAE